MFASYEEAEAYLLSTIDESTSPRTSYKLDRIEAFLRELGDPHREYPAIHVGGTSGKGSTTTMIAGALQASGKRTGLHTKPHLHSMTERARIDGVSVAPERFTELLNEMMPAVERVTATFGRPTYYETLLSLAFLHFARERVDVACIEVGLGGRLDGTNVLVPVVAAITSIGFDHTEILGNTIEEIAAEKAGIAKPGVPLVLAGVPPAAEMVVREAAARVGAPLIRVGDVARIEPGEIAGATQSFYVVTSRARYAINTAVRGGFQRDNAAAAIAVLEGLPAPLQPPADSVEEAFENLVLPGRFELRERPSVIFDIAHNPEKASRLAGTLREEFGSMHVRYVVAIGESKDAKEILAALRSVPSASFALTNFETPGRHAIDPSELAAVAGSIGLEADVFDDPHAAYEAALASQRAGDVVVVTGSTFVVAELRDRRKHLASQPSAR